ncbi:MAG: hypothetical protein KatS3mg035_2002 [Bacteroidia bacterium]|nr:MAG: hypothetical protein KatS3mg035_2002 [Bacteroidia bacterium]
MNDNFVPTAIGVIEYELLIYDRWGKLVFSNDGDMTKRWNGKLNNTGKDCAEGVYYYRFKAKRFNGETFTRFGM